MKKVDKILDNGQYKNIIKNQDDDEYQLFPNKKALKKLYNQILDSLPSYQIIDWYSKNELEKLDTQAVNNERKEDILTCNKIIKIIYPNPAKDHINIEFNEGNQYEILVYNNLAQIVRREIMYGSSKKIDLNNLDNGTYYIKAYIKNMTVFETKKIIIKN